ncbi:phosphotransferase enzyme family protein [Vibrio mangrovi]|uniref:Phosphotransferase n=1 Tax=Vibrio mangrovi TaxID=474394 RepID=A0A1Y6J1E8_9VIBR|nr:phosphotransferase [Vibrio mangrovi]MDW6005417.1 phosphotransferase [Vibrio mangrovi]SMS02143.1 serine/threonine protein kinase [Vibrio mangrovi]
MNTARHNESAVIESRLNGNVIGPTVAGYFNLPAYNGCEFFFRGCNDTYRLKTIGHHYALRVYRYGWRSLAEIRSELKLLEQLGLIAEIVASPVIPESKDPIITFEAPEGKRYAILFEWVAGHPPDYASSQQAETFGVNMAKLHQSFDLLPMTETRKPIDLDVLFRQPMEKLMSQKSITPDNKQVLEQVEQLLKLRLTHQALSSLSWGLCHGDAHAGNARISGEQLFFFDFDFCGPGWRLYDLATYCWASMLRWQPEECRQAFLQGYLTQGNLPPQSIDLLKEFVILRQLWFLGYELERQNIVGCGYFSTEYFSHHIGFLKYLMETIK